MLARAGVQSGTQQRDYPGSDRRTKGTGMRVVVLGGDGFCGWPTALHLSAAGHEVTIVDNLVRRKIDIELEVESLTPIKPLSTRLAAWEETSGTRIPFVNLDVA